MASPPVSTDTASTRNACASAPPSRPVQCSGDGSSQAGPIKVTMATSRSAIAGDQQATAETVSAGPMPRFIKPARMCAIARFSSWRTRSLVMPSSSPMS